ncbi:hemolysin A [Solidesulfovibrio fructosivorans JJ]]|uniref:Hemolysin A n=1 Tax=Solidesulfovibrio fructosivorans JJ] TaxID=596151 RepID=E1K203_SOLFR|nr:TlyA family RNA methyltransferase [Solidesulfovibrio fructosivorans]EFL49361.1 hemolysin A [Solidesulfovibrio fructosivorans JJ]]
MAKEKFRADQLVCEQGLADTRERAKRLVMAGLVRVVADGRETIVDKPGRMFPAGTVFCLEQGERYVSRGGGKLETAIEAFGLDFSGLVALDAGASTGGFTDCLLQHGAARVYAVDVGTAQLHEKLRADARVVSMEQVNLRHAPDDLLPESVHVVVADVSFISLTKVLPACVRFLLPGGLVAVLVKPQFELTPDKVGKGGVVREEAHRQEAIARVTEFARDELGLTLTGVVPSKVKGPKGNQEYMAVFSLGENCPESADGFDLEPA